MATKREHLLIDGYNLIKASQLFQGRDDTLERARNRLQQALVAYGRRADKHITLYYDGTGESPSAASASSPHVTIEFSRYPEQADDLIAQAVEKKHGAKWLRVISSDRAVQRCAARHKIRSTCSEDFLDELTGPVQAPSAPAPAPDRDGTEANPSLDPGELDQWETLFRKEANEEPSTPAPDRDGTESHPPLNPSELDQWEALFRRGADR
ncbi:MAG: NYN domain-containing protein [Gemmatimonadetes bacterium]|nr:NYN domain-containing protein [Gemmatimonadota bacterium]